LRSKIRPLDKAAVRPLQADPLRLKAFPNQTVVMPAAAKNTGATNLD
jgi:hypothetical protein